MTKRRSTPEETVVIVCVVCYSQVEITQEQFDNDHLMPRCPYCLASECGYA